MRGNIMRHTFKYMEKLTNLLKQLEVGDYLKLGFIGGSITQGCNPSVPERAYVERVTRWFKEKYPNVEVERINGGVGATGSLIGVHRVERDIIRYQPDIVFVEFAANDVSPKTNTNLSYESLIRKLLLELPPTSAVVEIFMTLQDGESAEEEEAAIAEYYKLPSVSYRKEIFRQIEAGSYTWEDIETDEVHPNDRGHGIIASLISELVEEALKQEISKDYRYIMPKKPLFSDIYVEGQLLKFKEVTILEEIGFSPSVEDFRTINTGYSTNLDAEKVYLKCEVEAKNIFLLYVKGIDEVRAKAKIIIDGKEELLLDTRYPNGWGNYPETYQLVAGENKKKYVIEVSMPEEELGNKLTLLGFLVS